MSFKTREESLNFNLETHYLDALESPWYRQLCILQDEITQATFRFFNEKGIKSISLPITTGSITSPMGLGSDSLPVKINLEGIETYLSDSMQFHLEYGLRLFNKGTHYIMPSFRGEKADKRHLCQFYHSEAEIMGGLESVIQLVNQYVHFLSTHILNTCKSILENNGHDTEHIEHIVSLQGNYPQITFEDACELLHNDSKYIEQNDAGFRTITNEGERLLIKHFGEIVWLTHHDYLSVPFYQSGDSKNKYAKNGDLLFGIGEVIGAGERHENKDELINAMEYHSLSPENYEWYITMKNKFPMKTSGFGMGIERFILWITQHDDIRDCQLIPRFNGQLINP